MTRPESPPTVQRDGVSTDPMVVMRVALAAAAEAAEAGEVPVGAVIVGPDGGIVATARNRMREQCDPTAHAEMLVIRAVCALRRSERLPDHELYVTLEPCAMCAGAISFARLRRVVFGASDPKSGGVLVGPKVFDHPTCHHRPDVVEGLGAADSAAMLKAFFAARRPPRPGVSDAGPLPPTGRSR